MLCASLTTRLTTRCFIGLIEKKIKTGALAVSMATIPEFRNFSKLFPAKIKVTGGGTRTVFIRL